MKKIKVKVKETRKVTEDFAKEVYCQGMWLTHCAVESRGGLLYDFFTCRYEGKIYFLVVIDNKIKECIEL